MSVNKSSPNAVSKKLSAKSSPVKVVISVHVIIYLKCHCQIYTRVTFLKKCLVMNAENIISKLL